MGPSRGDFGHDVLLIMRKNDNIRKYPSGTRIQLDHMDDLFPVPDGTVGTVDYVDDAGQIHMIWDNGRTLALVSGEDEFHII